MKKLINSPNDVVPELLEGLTRLSPDLVLMPEHTVVLRDGSPAHVAVISGGGSGHEPAHAGYVGPGLLRAAVAGDVFASPSVDSVLAAIRAVAGPAGVLLVIKNYTGDRLNFGLAAEIARNEGTRVETVVVDDDVALANNPHVGRRGIAGTVLIHKIAGAAAEAGADLATVAAEARAAIAALGSIGVALSSCTVPAALAPNFSLGENEIELGLGIHGEAGVHRLPMASASTLVRDMLCRIIKDRDLHPGDRVALLVNNLGTTTQSEMLIVCRASLAFLAGEGIVVERCWQGTFLTALDMQGCSLSLLRLDPARLARLDAPAHAPSWPGPAARPGTPRLQAPASGDRDDTGPASRNDEFEAALRAVTTAILAAEARLNALDRDAGDGDLGASLARGARALEDDLPRYDLDHPAAALEAMAGTVRRSAGGSSGPLYAVFMLRAARALEGTGPASIAAAFDAGWRAMAELGDARPGDCTMIDALAPASAAFGERLGAGGSLADAIAAAADAAAAGAKATVPMIPKRGRASYLADRAVGHPDPGASAVALWLAALRDHVSDVAP